VEIKSDFALLDVKTGRGPLKKHFAKRPRFGGCPPAMRIPVTITGYIDDVWGGDDGVSREFGVVVQSVKIKKSSTR
jgi:hypothetical protein